ncbi:hypothetical protein ACKTEK_03645 [Tepidamorphus sp. 3E244]|uniref:hypothetical protein n=1 Tax=Tepidamorphus sp. 3E244 TaxID=3385498 RepID=UPI0038FC08D3
MSQTSKTTRFFRPARVTLAATAVALVAFPLTFAAAEMRGGDGPQQYAHAKGHGGQHGEGRHARRHEGGHGKHHMRHGRGHHGKGMGKGKGLERMFEKADLDGDGNLTADEVNQIRSERFARVDLDGDGNLTITEIAKAQEAARQAMRDARALRSVANARGFTKTDADENGSISAEEYTSARERMFSRLDTDGDGGISAEELSAAKERFAERRGGGRGHGGYGKGHGMGHGKGHGMGQGMNDDGPDGDDADENKPAE